MQEPFRFLAAACLHGFLACKEAMEAFLICTRIPFSWGLLMPRRSLFEGLFGCSLWVRRVAEKPVDGVFFKRLLFLKGTFLPMTPFPC
ncbi:putative lipoprotein [Acidaminococcus sp. BV3L6]|nr:putative lipoprotein [Acidaminococcus sp. BV3L6]